MPSTWLMRLPRLRPKTTMKSREETTGASVVWVQRRRTRWHSRRESQRKLCQGRASDCSFIPDKLARRLGHLERALDRGADSDHPRPSVGPENRADLGDVERIAAEDRPARLHEVLGGFGIADVLHDPCIGSVVVAPARVVDQPLNRARPRPDLPNALDLIAEGEDRL